MTFSYKVLRANFLPSYFSLDFMILVWFDCMHEINHGVLTLSLARFASYDVLGLQSLFLRMVLLCFPFQLKNSPYMPCFLHPCLIGWWTLGLISFARDSAVTNGHRKHGCASVECWLWLLQVYHRGRFITTWWRPVLIACGCGALCPHCSIKGSFPLNPH